MKEQCKAAAWKTKSKLSAFSIKHFVLMLFLIGSATAQPSHAGWLNTVRESFTDRLSYHIRVLDDHERSLSGVAIWWSNIDEDDYLNWKVAMTRLFDRYAVDYDYARPLGLMNSRMIVEYSNSQGELNWEWKTKKTPKIVFTALKRGYKPTLIEIQSKSNTTQELVFRLERNPEETVDPRMENFDRLRAEIFNSESIGMMTEAREAFIQRKHEEMREIAISLEKDQPELAARVYINLADLPSVDIFRRSDGTAIGRGFTNELPPKFRSPREGV